MHITLKLKYTSLRTHQMHKAMKRAAIRAKQYGLYILHYSILDDHIHAVVEAKSNDALATGMKCLCGSLGRAFRKLLGGKGAVFKDRYHMHVLRTPTEMKNALKYVLVNAARHMKVIEHIDEFSSGARSAFRRWRELLGQRFNALVEHQLEGCRAVLEELSQPRSWLAAVGWRRARGA